MLNTIDRFHQINQQELKQLPYLIRYWLDSQTENNNVPFGDQAVEWIVERLALMGCSVELMPANNAYDLMVGYGPACIRVEAKGSQAYYNHAKRAWRYQAAIRNNQCDLLIFVCLTNKNHRRFFVVPKAALGQRRNIAIWSLDPRQYGGLWSPYLEAWQYVWQVLDQAKPVLRQGSLWHA